MLCPAVADLLPAPLSRSTETWPKDENSLSLFSSLSHQSLPVEMDFPTNVNYNTSTTKNTFFFQKEKAPMINLGFNCQVSPSSSQMSNTWEDTQRITEISTSSVYFCQCFSNRSHSYAVFSFLTLELLFPLVFSSNPFTFLFKQVYSNVKLYILTINRTL